MAKKVFVADDDLAILDSLKRMLMLSGFTVEVTGDPKEIMTKVKSFKPDIILLDLLMPHLGGLEICEMLNADKDTQGIPIIIISSLAGYTDIKKAYQLGVIGYITKPYDFAKLLEEIKSAIDFKEGHS